MVNDIARCTCSDLNRFADLAAAIVWTQRGGDRRPRTLLVYDTTADISTKEAHTVVQRTRTEIQNKNNKKKTSVGSGGD